MPVSERINKKWGFQFNENLNWSKLFGEYNLIVFRFAKSISLREASLHNYSVGQRHIFASDNQSHMPLKEFGAAQAICTG